MATDHAKQTTAPSPVKAMLMTVGVPSLLAALATAALWYVFLERTLKVSPASHLPQPLVAAAANPAVGHDAGHAAPAPSAAAKEPSHTAPALPGHQKTDDHAAPHEAAAPGAPKAPPALPSPAGHAPAHPPALAPAHAPEKHGEKSAGKAGHDAHAAGHGAAPHWGYEHENGPAKWGALGVELAEKGLRQSPIDINPDTALASESLPEIRFYYSDGPMEIVNNGHTIQANCAPGNFATIDDQPYQLLQFHFHLPSEHTIKGRFAPLEVHLVHKHVLDGRLAVVGVLIEQGDTEHPLITKVWSKMPAEKDGKAKATEAGLNPAQLLPVARGYFRYNGSLTTPPCTEGVLWTVMTEQVHCSTAQVDAFRKLFPLNARPPQALKGRFVLKSAPFGAASATIPAPAPKRRRRPIASKCQIRGRVGGLYSRA